jgi:hypothetical protein
MTAIAAVASGIGAAALARAATGRGGSNRDGRS